MERLIQQVLERVNGFEAKLMKFVHMVSADVQTIGATLNAQSQEIAALKRAVNAQGKTLAGFNEMAVAYSPQPIGPNVVGPRTRSVPTHAPMTPRTVGHETPRAAEVVDAARAGSPVAQAAMPTAKPAMSDFSSEEEAIFYGGGEDD